MFTATPGVQPGMEQKSPIDFFRLFFSGQVLQLIHTETKRYTEQYLEREREHLEQHPKARAHEWRRAPLLLKELEIFLAILIAMGICGFPTLRYTGKINAHTCITESTTLYNLDFILLYGNERSTNPHMLFHYAEPFVCLADVCVMW